MFDSIDEILKSVLEPLGSTGRNVILVVATALLIFTIVMALIALSKQRFVKLLLWIVISIGIFILGTRGYNITKTLGEKQGDDFDGQISALIAFSIVPTYLMHLKYKKLRQNTK